MLCDPWKARLNTYVDDELSEEERQILEVHLRKCASCAADALERAQMKRALQVAGRRYAPSAEFRKRIQQKIAARPRRLLNQSWTFAAASVVVLVIGAMSSIYVIDRSARNHVLSEVADMHVASLASSSPVDVISTDRHTVKPWFQGRIPFAFNLPEMHATAFVLLGGRMAYLDQTPGAQLIYDAGKHHISVFIFPNAALRSNLSEQSTLPEKQPFNMETWSQDRLRYFIIGDASATEIDQLARLFKAQ